MVNISCDHKGTLKTLPIIAFWKKVSFKKVFYTITMIFVKITRTT